MPTPFFPGMDSASSLPDPSLPSPSLPEPTPKRAPAEAHLAMLRLAKQLEGVHPKVGTTALCTLMCACADQAGLSLDDLQKLVADTHKKTHGAIR